MTVTVTSTLAGPFAPNGVTTSFPFPFKAASTSEVRVFSTSGSVSSNVNPSLYTVTLDSDEEGGTVTFSSPPSPALGSLYILGMPSFRQDAQFSNNGFLPSSLNPAFDRAALRDLYLKHLIETLDVKSTAASANALAKALAVQTQLNGFTSFTEQNLNSLDARVDAEEQASAAILAALGGISVPGVLPLQAFSIAAAKVMTGLYLGMQVFVSEAGREGVWKVVDHASVSASVTFDATYNIRHFRSTVEPAFAFERVILGDVWYASWAGFNEANLSTNHLRLRALEALRPAGSTVILPAGTFTGFGGALGNSAEPNVAMYKPGVWRGQGEATVITPGNNASYCIGMNTSGCIIERVKFANWQPGYGANTPACIDVSRTHTAMLGFNQGPGELRGSKVRDCIFENVACAVRVINSLYDTDLAANDASTAVAVNHPSDIEFSGNTLLDVSYQGFSLWGRRIRAFNNHVQMRKRLPSHLGHLGAVDFDCAFRLVGCSHSLITNNTIRCLTVMPAFWVNSSIQGGDTGPGLESGIEVMDPRALLISNNEVNMPNGSPFVRSSGFTGTILFSDNTVRGAREYALEALNLFQIDGGNGVRKWGQFIVDGGHYEGYAQVLVVFGGGLGRIIFRNGSSTGNAFDTPGVINGIFETAWSGGPNVVGAPLEPTVSIEVKNWNHNGPNITPAFLNWTNAPAGVIASVKNCEGPAGIQFWVGLGGTPDPGVIVHESGNTKHPASLWTNSRTPDTGYAHSPRYSDNGVLFWNGAYNSYEASLANPDLKIPADVEEDGDP